MLSVLRSCVVSGLLILWTLGAASPHEYFQKMVFDMVNRGSYNVTACVEELLNCWEVIKPDMLCHAQSKYDYISSCSLMKHHCSEKLGPLDNMRTRLMMVESFCSEVGNLTVTT